MALHEHKLWIEHDARPDYAPVTITCRCAEPPIEGVTQVEARTVQAAMRKITPHIVRSERETEEEHRLHRRDR